MKQLSCFLLCATLSLDVLWRCTAAEKELIYVTANELTLDESNVGHGSSALTKRKKGKIKKSKTKTKDSKKSKSESKQSDDEEEPNKKSDDEEEPKKRRGIDEKNAAKLRGEDKPKRKVDDGTEFGVASSRTASCGPGYVVEEGQLHTAKKRKDWQCMVQLEGYSDVYSENECDPDDARHNWLFCSGGQFVNKYTAQCLTYEDNRWKWDEIGLENCDWNSKNQKFDRLDKRDRKVDATTFDGIASVRTEFRLKARSGGDHCLSGWECWPTGCYIGADYCKKHLSHFFFMKNSNKDRFSHWDSYAWPSFYDEAHDGIVGSTLMYGFATIRYYLREGYYEEDTQTALSKYFFENDMRPTQPVTLQEIYNVALEQNISTINVQYQDSITDWLGIWSQEQRENTSLHFFSDTLPEQSPLAYGVFVEKQWKRISVWIKGSETIGNEKDAYFTDWSVKNINCNKVPWEDTSAHDGYSTVVDANKKNIRDELVKLFETGYYNDYKVYIFGHSMGGATATLLGYFLASTHYKNPTEELPMPISIMSHGSPQVGGLHLQKNTYTLEREGLLRHMRLENDGDVAPDTSGGACFLDYRNVALEIHMDYPKYEMLFYAKKIGIVYEKIGTRRLSEEEDKARRRLRASDLIETMENDPLPQVYSFFSRTLQPCTICAIWWHTGEAYLASLYYMFKDKGLTLNREYEKFLA